MIELTKQNKTFCDYVKKNVYLTVREGHTDTHRHIDTQTHIPTYRPQ